MKAFLVHFASTAFLALTLFGAAQDALAWPYLQRCAADLNRDGRVGLTDLGIFLPLLSEGNARADLNCNGLTDQHDLDVLTANFGGCLTCKGDVNGDGRVNRKDLNTLRAHFGKRFRPADFNRNGVVDLSDLGTLLSRYGKRCAALRPCQCPDLDGDLVVGLSDLGLVEAHQGDSALSAYDLNGDERVDQQDIDYVVAHFGSHCN